MSSDDPNIELTEPKGERGVIDADLLDRYVSGQASSADEEVVHTLRAEYPAIDELVSAMRAVPAGGIPVQRQADVMLGWKRFLEQQQQAERGARQLSRAVQLREGFKAGLLQIGVFQTQPLRWGIWYVVSAILICVVAINLGRRVRRLHSGNQGQVAVSTYATGNGERATITLPDGNTVALNVASRLEVPADYLAGNHTLHLTGEAFFSIKHRTGIPFTVIAEMDTAEVLGTSFLVQHYPSDATAIIAVREGKVAVHGRVMRSVVLIAGRQVTIRRMGDMQLGDAEEGQFSFARGVLTFASTPLSAAIPALDRWYDAVIRLGDSTLVSQHLTGAFPAGSLSDLTEFLEGTYNVRVVRTGRVLMIYGR